MFYYPTVLKRHTGCFSTIWLVATRGIRITRRDFLKVNVTSTCDDIMNYVLEQVPPPRPGLPRPRFSLYLSSQLQYGVVVVFHRQCAIFLEELQSVLGKLAKPGTSQNIDLDDSSRQAVDFPDALSLLEETEGAPDPLFGIMQMQDAMPSPNSLIKIGRERWMTESSPQHSEVPSSAAAAAESGITASPESITLREREPVTIPIAEFEGVELEYQHPDTIDLLMAQTDYFPEGEEDIPGEDVIPGESEMEREMEREEDRERDRTKELTASTIESQTATRLKEDAVLLFLEESVEPPGPPADQLTPVSGPALPSSPPSPHRGRERAQLEQDSPSSRRASPVVRRRRKRQLIFFDPETQIPYEEHQQRLEDPHVETRPMVLPTPPSQRMPSAAELLNNPCTFLPEDVLNLWKELATIKPISDLDLVAGQRGQESTDSEKERDREMVEVAQREEGGLELSSKEVPRDLRESEMHAISAHSSILLESSDQRDMPPVTTPEREGSPTPARSVATLQDIPEADEMQEAALSPGQLLESAESEDTPVFFHSLLPPDANRRYVSNIFQRLLVPLSAGEIHVEQHEHYGDILILPGPKLEEWLLTL